MIASAAMSLALRSQRRCRFNDVQRSTMSASKALGAVTRHFSHDERCQAVAVDTTLAKIPLPRWTPTSLTLGHLHPDESRNG